MVVASVAPIRARTVPCLCHIGINTRHEPTRGIKVGDSHVGRSTGARLAAMSSYMLVVLVIVCFLQPLLQTSLVQGAVVPQSIHNGTMNATLQATPGYCNSFPDWVGDGIIQSDCTDAISEFFRQNVEPRGRQEYEFLNRGDTRSTYLPYINTPSKYDYGE